MPEPGKLEILKQVQAASTVGALCMSREALRWSIDMLCVWLNMYNLEVWSILCERETCTVSVKELEEVLAVEESTDEEAELGKEKARYDAKRAATVRQKVVEEEEEDGGKDKGKSEGVEEEDEDEDEPMCSSRLSAKAKGKRPAK